MRFWGLAYVAPCMPHTDAMDGVIITSPERMASRGNTGNTAVK